VPEISEWWRDHKRELKYNHVSDVARMVLLYQYGGVYLDTDYLTLRPLTALKNTLGTSVLRGL
jgi:lactosylceramide 4-alpha-galactosyltransferase